MKKTASLALALLIGLGPGFDLSQALAESRQGPIKALPADTITPGGGALNEIPVNPAERSLLDASETCEQTDETPHILEEAPANDVIPSATAADEKPPAADPTSSDLLRDIHQAVAPASIRSDGAKATAELDKRYSNSGTRGPIDSISSVDAGNTAPAARSTDEMEKAQLVKSLSEDVIPTAYDIHMRVNHESEQFSGSEKIKVTVAKRTDKITMHARELLIDGAKIFSGGRKIPIKRITKNKTQGTVTFHLEKSPKKGSAQIELEFSGLVNKQMKGLYVTETNEDGKIEKQLTTQFEPDEASRMFPGWHEPRFKAKFTMTVTAPKDMTVISNMHALKRAVEGPLQTVTFAESPKMSTYLVAVEVGQLAKISRKAGGIDVNVYARRRDIKQVQFSLDVAVETLTLLNKYFGKKYPLKKLDLVAVTELAAGAMENYGAIFFSDILILIDPKLSSAKAMMDVADTVAHEIVHQWFGNLVTMKDWRSLWLKEAFATLLATHVVHKLFPKWNAWHTYRKNLREAYLVDSLDNTRPIEPDSAVKDPNTMYDSLSYEKGAAVINGIKRIILGDAAFQKSMKHYVKKFGYRTVVQNDLFETFEKISKKPVADLARGWINQPGYPIVTVTALSKDNRTLQLSQRRFNAHGKKNSDALWTIPMAIRFKDKDGVHIEQITFDKRSTIIRLPGKGTVQWLYPNDAEEGFYRIKLQDKLLNALLTNSETALKPVEGIGLLSHLWGQVLANEIGIDRFLQVLLDLKQTKSRVYLDEAAGYLENILEHFSPTFVKEEDRILFARYVEDLFNDQFNRLKWDGTPNESVERKVSRAAVIQALGTLAQSDKIIPEAERRLKLYLENPTRVDASLAVPLLLIGAYRGGPELFAAYKQRLFKSTTPEERLNYYEALAAFNQPELAAEYLPMILAKDELGHDIINGQDMRYPISYTLQHRNPKIQRLAWEYIKKNWPEIKKKGGFENTSSTIDDLDGLPKDLKDDVQSFFKNPKNGGPSVELTLAQSLESIDLNFETEINQRENLSRWLRLHYLNTPRRPAAPSRILGRIEDDVRRAHQSGRSPVVIFDIDDTLISMTRPKTLAFQETVQQLKQSGYSDEMKKLSGVMDRSVQSGLDLEKTLRQHGIDDPGFRMKFLTLWREIYKSGKYITEGRIIPGAVEYLRELEAAGAKIVYLTARHEISMGAATRETLRSFGFPMGSEIRLFLKTDLSITDLEYKIRALDEIAGMGEVVAGFENEPANLNAFMERFPEMRGVFLETTQGDPTEPAPAGALKVPDFISNAFSFDMLPSAYLARSSLNRPFFGSFAGRA